MAQNSLHYVESEQDDDIVEEWSSVERNLFTSFAPQIAAPAAFKAANREPQPSALAGNKNGLPANAAIGASKTGFTLPSGTVKLVRPPNLSSVLTQPRKSDYIRRITITTAPKNAGGGVIVPKSGPKTTYAPPAPVISLKYCVRRGCKNEAVESPEWDEQYCSHKCLIEHCKTVFAEWVEERKHNAAVAQKLKK